MRRERSISIIGEAFVKRSFGLINKNVFEFYMRCFI